jgi:hypothetical protein
MAWFTRKKKEEQLVAKQKVEKEIAMHKKSIKKNVDTVKRVATKFNKDFEENGFTVKIFSAMGGKDPKQKIGTH